MKKLLVFLFSGLLVFSIVSCGGGKDDETTTDDAAAGSLEDLKEKYKDAEFEDCDEFLNAANEIFEVYFVTIDKAYDGDEDAEAELEEFEDFLAGFEDVADDFESECPEKFEEFEKDLEEEMAEYFDKIMEMYSDDMGDYDDDWDDEWDEEMTDEEWEELMNEMTDEDWEEFEQALDEMTDEEWEELMNE